MRYSFIYYIYFECNFFYVIGLFVNCKYVVSLGLSIEWIYVILWIDFDINGYVNDIVKVLILYSFVKYFFYCIEKKLWYFCVGN